MNNQEKVVRIQNIFIEKLILKLDHGYKCHDNQTITANLTIHNTFFSVIS